MGLWASILNTNKQNLKINETDIQNNVNISVYIYIYIYLYMYDSHRSVSMR